MSAEDYYKITKDWGSLSPVDLERLTRQGVITDHLDSDDLDQTGGASGDYGGMHSKTPEFSPIGD